MHMVAVYIKAAGAICVASGCLGIGINISRNYRLRENQIRQLILMLQLLQGEIRYAQPTLPDAFMHIESRLEAPLSKFLSAVAADMRAMEGTTLPAIWQKRMDTELTGVRLGNREMAILQQLGGQLGFLDQTMQLETLHLYMEELSALMKDYSQTVGQHQKICLSLSLMAGLFLTIILI